MLSTTDLKPEFDGTFAKVLDSFYVYAGDLSDIYVQKFFREFGYWDEELTLWMVKNIKPGWTCLDIGANTFYFAELLARLVGENGKVLAFEPIKRLCEMHHQIKSFNRGPEIADIEIYNYGLSDSHGDKIIAIWDTNVGGSGIIGHHVEAVDAEHGNLHTENIKVKRLDEVFTDKIDFIKMDIEGHESWAFEGFPESALECPLLVVELGMHQPQKFFDWLEENYVMEFLNGTIATTEEIKKHHVVNVLLKKI
jgi:FkbM family methyltransferase